ncbi:MAG TPA: response regulator [Rhizomicrobium sp.]|jgi:two-component system chemotaxis response regulator CheY|nr:response regulator [Rhizomicrobium sp.]
MAAAAKLQVIVVDDQMTMRALVRTGLNQIGISQVREFASAEEANQNLTVQPAHVIISDFNMPGMDGLEFLRAVRAKAENKNTAFLLLTGRADKDLVARAIQFGANNYLVKPFTVATLKQKIEQVVGALT